MSQAAAPCWLRGLPRVCVLSGVLDVPTSAIFAAPTARALARYAAALTSQNLAHDASIAKPAQRPPSQRGARQRAAFARLRPASSPDEEVR